MFSRKKRKQGTQGKARAMCQNEPRREAQYYVLDLDDCVVERVTAEQAKKHVTEEASEDEAQTPPRGPQGIRGFIRDMVDSDSDDRSTPIQGLKGFIRDIVDNRSPKQNRRKHAKSEGSADSSDKTDSDSCHSKDPPDGCPPDLVRQEDRRDLNESPDAIALASQVKVLRHYKQTQPESIKDLKKSHRITYPNPKLSIPSDCIQEFEVHTPYDNNTPVIQELPMKLRESTKEDKQASKRQDIVEMPARPVIKMKSPSSDGNQKHTSVIPSSRQEIIQVPARQIIQVNPQRDSSNKEKQNKHSQSEQSQRQDILSLPARKVIHILSGKPEMIDRPQAPPPRSNQITPGNPVVIDRRGHQHVQVAKVSPLMQNGKPYHRERQNQSSRPGVQQPGVPQGSNIVHVRLEMAGVPDRVGEQPIGEGTGEVKAATENKNINSTPVTDQRTEIIQGQKKHMLKLKVEGRKSQYFIPSIETKPIQDGKQPKGAIQPYYGARICIPQSGVKPKPSRQRKEANNETEQEKVKL